MVWLSLSVGGSKLHGSSSWLLLAMFHPADGWRGDCGLGWLLFDERGMCHNAHGCIYLRLGDM